MAVERECSGVVQWRRTVGGECSRFQDSLCSSNTSDSDRASEGDRELLNSVSLASTFAP